MREKISCKEAFAERLLEMAREDDRIMVLCSDSKGSSNMTPFSQALPDQYVECGIAEQDEVGIAAGLASVGMHPYVCAPASFLSSRSLEQAKVDLAYSHQNVKIFGVSGGVSYGALGASHHSLHDIATFRCFPDFDVFVPSDATQTVAMLEAIEQIDRPAYIRVGRRALPSVYEEVQGAFTYGKANLLKDGEDVTVIACGELVHPALQAARRLADRGLSVRVLDIPSLKPFDAEAVRRAADETGAILTVEEHSVNGGLGAAVSQTVVEHAPVPMRIMAFPDTFLVTGESEDLFRHYHLDEEGIAEQLVRLAKRKRSR